MRNFPYNLPEAFVVRNPKEVADYVAYASARTALGEHLGYICRALTNYLPEDTTLTLGVFAILMPPDVPGRYAPLGPPFNWLTVDIYPPCGALEAIERLRQFEERKLWPLYEQPGKDFGYLLRLSLPDIPVELIEHDSDERIRQAGDEP